MKNSSSEFLNKRDWLKKPGKKISLIFSYGILFENLNVLENIKDGHTVVTRFC